MLLGIIGGGRWGTALAKVLADNFSSIKIFAKDNEVVKSINQSHINQKYLPQLALEKHIEATNHIQDMANADIILITTPTQHIRKTLQKLKCTHNAIFLICSKGIESSSGKLISSILIDDLQIKNIGVLSGPSFANEVIKGLPTALVLAREIYDENLMLKLTTTHLRIYYSNDIIGSQVGGAVKNVIAIAGGIIKGSSLGDNALAALISRGLHEILILNQYFGGKDSSIFGLTGLGDLLLTASSANSRNYSLGYNIGLTGNFKLEMINNLQGVAEGYSTVKVLSKIMKENNLNMPICQEVYEILYKHKALKDSLKALMDRPLKQEFHARNTIN